MFCCVEFSSPCFKNTNTAWGLREQVVKNGKKRGKVDVFAHVAISLSALLASVCLMLVRDQNACDFCNVNFSSLLLSATVLFGKGKEDYTNSWLAQFYVVFS